jgi:hypothetical protein
MSVDFFFNISRCLYSPCFAIIKGTATVGAVSDTEVFNVDGAGKVLAKGLCFSLMSS